MTIQKEFVLRHHDDGHVRFQIPAQICDAAVAKVVADSILALDGVYPSQFISWAAQIID